jgi:anaerobic selenocysteine-containing dehydrogenase
MGCDVREVSPSFCRLCGSYCPILVTVEDGRAVEVKGDRAAPLYDGYTCPKGRALPEQHYTPSRLLSSMKRGPDGQYAPIASEQAMDEIADRVTKIIEEHGPRSVALYTGTGISSFFEVVHVASAWMRAIESPMTFSANTIDKPGVQLAQAAHGNWSAGHPPFGAADAWILVGTNPIISKSSAFPPNNPGLRIKEAVRERGFKLIVIDPRATDTAKRAYIHLQVRPGEDPSVLAALLNVIIQEKLYDAAFVAGNVDGFDALARAVAPFTPDYAAQRAGVPADKLIEAARVFAQARSAGVGCGVGPSFALTGEITEYLSSCLMTLCGFWSRAGDTVRKPNVLLPPYTPRAEAMPPFPGWGYEQKLRVRGLGLSASGWPTAALAEEILLEGPGQIRALFCFGGNPLMAFPDQNLAHRALTSLDLLVTSDWTMSATARVSHYVMAPKLTLETPNTTALLEQIKYFNQLWGIDGPYAQYTPKIVDPPADSDLIEDWELYYGLAKRMGLPLTVKLSYGMGPHADLPPRSFDLSLESKPTTDELIELIYEGSRVPLSEIKKYPHGHVFHEADQIVEPKRPDSTAKLDAGNPYMMSKLEALTQTPPPKPPDDKHLLLLPRRANRVVNSAGRNLPKLMGEITYNPAFMHPDDLARLGLAAGDKVKITSEHGSVISFAGVDDGLRHGCLSMTHAYGANPGEDEDPELVGCNIGCLTSTAAEFDPITGIPRMGALPVTVEKLPGGHTAPGSRAI